MVLRGLKRGAVERVLDLVFDNGNVTDGWRAEERLLPDANCKTAVDIF